MYALLLLVAKHETVFCRMDRVNTEKFNFPYTFKSFITRKKSFYYTLTNLRESL